MKNLLLPFCLLILINGCNEVEIQKASGRIKFSVNQTDASANGRKTETDDPAKLLISLEDNNGNLIHDLKELNIYSFEDTYISEELSLDAGMYKITAVFLANSSNDILFATPITGSEASALVDHPLPIEFTIQSEQVESVSLEVVDVTGTTPEELGYASFSITKSNRSFFENCC